MQTRLGLQCLNCGHVWYVDRSRPTPNGRPFVAELQTADLIRCPDCGGFELHSWEVGKDAARTT